MPIFSDVLIRTFASSNNLSQLVNDYVDKKICLSVKSLSYEPNVKNYDIFSKEEEYCDLECKLFSNDAFWPKIVESGKISVERKLL